MKRLLLGLCIAVFVVLPNASNLLAQEFSESGGDMVEVAIFNQCASETFDKIFTKEKYRTRFHRYLLDEGRWHKKGFNEFNKFRECVLAKGSETGAMVPLSDVQAAVDAATAGMVPASEVQVAAVDAVGGVVIAADGTEGSERSRIVGGMRLPYNEQAFFAGQAACWDWHKVSSRSVLEGHGDTEREFTGDPFEYDASEIEEGFNPWIVGVSVIGQRNGGPSARTQQCINQIADQWDDVYGPIVESGRITTEDFISMCGRFDGECMGTQACGAETDGSFRFASEVASILQAPIDGRCVVSNDGDELDCPFMHRPLGDPDAWKQSKQYGLGCAERPE